MSFESFLFSGSSLNPSIAWSRGKREGRFRITFPLESSWYKDQICTRFQSLQHRKERSGRFRHEFVVLKLMNDWICRIERMGDPDASFNAIGTQGIIAHDVIQSFPPDKLSEACLETSDVVAEITFPRCLDLKLVLLICRAMQEGEKTCNYTLQVFNCYFFALAIQATLTRLVADWGHSFRDEIWHFALGRGLSVLSDSYEASAWDQQPFMLRVHSALRPGTHWAAEDLLCNLKREICQFTEVLQVCNAVLWHTDIGLAVDHALCGRVRDVVMGVLKGQLDRHFDQRSCAKSIHIPRLDRVMIQLKKLLLELISWAISRHDDELQTSKLSRIQSNIQGNAHFVQEYKSFLSQVDQPKEWTLELQSRPDPPQPGPDPLQPRPNSPQPQPGLPEPYPDPSQSYPGSSQSRLDPSKPHPGSSQSDPNPPSSYHPDSSKPRPDPSQSTSLSLFFKTSQLSVWLKYAKMLALWAFQAVLGLFWIDVLGSAQPTLCMFVEDELESSLAILKESRHGSVDEFTLASQKLRSAPQLLVQWKEWPWDHIYQPIKRHILESLAEETDVLQISFLGNANQAVTVSKFQEHLRKRIRDHAKLVGYFWLGSAAEIQDEMEERISQVWALIRQDDTTTPTPIAAQPMIPEPTMPLVDPDDPIKPSSPSPSIISPTEPQGSSKEPEVSPKERPDREPSPPSPSGFGEDDELRKRSEGVLRPTESDDNLRHRYDLGRRSPLIDDDFMPTAPIDEGPSGFVHRYTGERRFYN